MHGSQLEIYNLCEDLDFDTRGDDIQQTVARHTKESVRRSNECVPAAPSQPPATDPPPAPFARPLGPPPGDTPWGRNNSPSLIAVDPVFNPFATRNDVGNNTCLRCLGSPPPRMMPLDTSLREYLRMLYYVPGDTHMSIHLRGHPVEQLFLGTLQGLASYLTGVDGLHYRPLNSEIENTEIALGVRVVMTDPGSGAKAIDIKGHPL